jgi:hypothetical protein
MTSPKEHIRKIEKAVEKHKRKYETDQYTSFRPDEIERMLSLSNNPWIIGYGFNTSTPGGTLPLSVGIYNPGALNGTNLYIHVWIGSGIVDPTGDTFLLNVDTRFPRLTEPGFPGLIVNSLSTADINLTLDIPATIEKTKYLLNICLMKISWRERIIFDRGIQVIEVS